jgi:hypothetical protein
VNDIRKYVSFRFWVLRAVSMKVPVFWDVSPRGLEEAHISDELASEYTA